MDRGKFGPLIIILSFVGFFAFLSRRLDSVDAKEVYLALFGYVFHPAVVILIVVIVAQFWGYKRLSKEYKNEIKRLVKYKHFFFHYKKKLFEIMKKWLESGQIHTFEDLKDFDIHDLHDVDHHSTSFSLGDDTGGRHD